MSDPAIYRPPLFVQRPGLLPDDPEQIKYSASDVRRLSEGIYLDGVLSPTHCKVVPRQAGANLSVDVLRGEVVVFGAQANEGRYLCAFQPGVKKVNKVIDPGPATGSTRYDMVGARVFENTGDWEVVVIKGNAAPGAGQWDSWQPNRPAGSSIYPLAIIGPIVSNTGQIGGGMILDCRWIARPTPLGGFVTLRRRMPEVQTGAGLVGFGDPVHLPVLPWDTDVSSTLTCVMRSSNWNSVVARTGFRRWPGDGGASYKDDYSLDWTSHFMDFRSVSRQNFFVVPASTSSAVQALMGWEQGDAQCRYHNGELVIRMTPRGALVE